jgi:uncharacterized protein (DUF433 family)
MDPAIPDVEVSMGITVNPCRLAGRPCVKGTRIPVIHVVQLLEGGELPAMSPRDIVENYPPLTYYDIANVRGWAKKRRAGRV